jgi:hypothetical protein
MYHIHTKFDEYVNYPTAKNSRRFWGRNIGVILGHHEQETASSEHIDINADESYDTRLAYGYFVYLRLSFHKH